MQSQLIARVLDGGTGGCRVVIRRDKEEPRILINSSSDVQFHLDCAYHGGEGREAAIDARPNHLISYVIKIER